MLRTLLVLVGLVWGGARVFAAMIDITDPGQLPIRLAIAKAVLALDGIAP